MRHYQRSDLAERTGSILEPKVEKIVFLLYYSSPKFHGYSR